MKYPELLHIAVAETSFVVRNGLVHALKHHLADFNNVQVVEITTFEGLHDYFQMHVPDVLVVNPMFGGGFNLDTFCTSFPKTDTKFISLSTSLMDPFLLKGYDESFSLYDEVETMNVKLVKLLCAEEEVEEADTQEVLSQREKEIIRCVVKGMTNKEIAEMLYISIHTVITHRRNIARKLQVHSPAGLTIYAIVNKLVEIGEVKI